jgi:hypothetical protein
MAFASDLTLSDDPYGTPGAGLSWKGQTLYLPARAVGRLVERPSDMTAQIEEFLAADGVHEVGRSLAAGYDFMQDAAEEVDRTVSDAGLPQHRRVGLFGDSWTLDLLRLSLLGERTDLAFFAVHAEHFAHDTPDGGEFRADELDTAGADLSGTVAFAAACHAGLSAAGDQHPEPVDFPQAWAGHGATFVGPTGYAYGCSEALCYQEDLMSRFASEMIAREGMAIGDALVWAKRDYFRSHDMSGIHAKTLAGTTLYGLPMARVRVYDMPDGAPSATGGDPVPGTAQERSGAGELDAIADIEVEARGLAALQQSWGTEVWSARWPYPLDSPTPTLHHTPDGDFYSFSGAQPRADAGAPVQPRFAETLGLLDRDGQILDPRSAIMISATYHAADHGFRPLVKTAGVLGEAARGYGPRNTRFSAPGWYPSVPFSLRRLDQAGTDMLLPGRGEARGVPSCTFCRLL